MPGKEKKAASKTGAKAAAPYKKSAASEAVSRNPKTTVSRFTPRPKNFGIGGDVPYKRDISRFMRWPTFVTRQRKKRVLERRLKVPPTLNQFRQVLDRSTRTEVLKLLKKYAPESRKERRERLLKHAAAMAKDPKKTAVSKAPLHVVSGLQEVTRAIERKKARLVVIANNVDPIELVLWMPALCRANSIPYAIVKDKARLGEVIGQKTAVCMALTAVRSEDEKVLKSMIKSVNARFMSRGAAIQRRWGGMQSSLRSQARQRKTKRVRPAVTNVGEDDE